MSELPNVSEEQNYFEKLFEKAEKEQTGDLYKKELYIMKEDLEKNGSCSKLKLIHDTLLQKLMVEEYNEFTPKSEIAKLIYPNEKKEENIDNNSNNIINNNLNKDSNNKENNNKNQEKEENVDKELLEEFEYLKELYRLNYLTFSPLSLDYLENINKFKNSKQNIKEKENINEDNILKIDYNFNDINEKNNENNEKITEEKEKKLLNLLNFDYNSFELNNDLLFNISQGFIDVSRLKESNIKIPPQELLKEDLNDSSDSSKNDEYDIYEYDEELDQDLINKTLNFIKKYENNLMFKGAIIRFRDELRNLPPKCKNKVKNEFYSKWEKEFIKLEINYEAFQNQGKDEEKKINNKKEKKFINKTKKNGKKNITKYEGPGDEFIDQLKKMQKDAFIKSGIKENEDEKERELIKKIKRKKYNRSVSNEKNEIVKSSKKYYCSGFNMYKDIISKRKKNANSKK